MLRREVERAVSSLRGCDIILVDTPGCDLSDARAIDNLSGELARVPAVETFLVLEAAGSKEISHAKHAFRSLDCERIVVTKLDRTGFIGPVINLALEGSAECPKPLAFFSTGTRMPEDIEPATARRLARLLVRSMH